MSFRDWILPGYMPGEHTMFTGVMDMGRKKDENVYDLNKLTENPEYTEGDKAAVHFMTEQAKQFDPEPEYITEYYVLWKTAGTNLPRWLGPRTEEEAEGLAISEVGGFVLTRVVEKEV